MTFRFAIIVVVAMTLACCGRQHDARLDRAADLAAQYPDSALALLDSIAPASLSAADRHYRDLLSIRAHDKAYHPHTSDSLILDVIDYYADHRSAPDHYPMALYYGGRVYDDLGDYPTAMKYFQDALDLLPPDTPDQALRCTVLSQYARLLNHLCLYDEAVPYIESVIEIDKQLKDTTNLIYDLQLFDEIYLQSGDFDLAESKLRKALDLSVNRPSRHSAKSLMFLAGVKRQKGEIDSALNLIRNIPYKVAPSVRNTALGYATNIYYKAGIMDTAYLYAKELINSNESSCQEVGYQILLNPGIAERHPIDTLCKYVAQYKILLLNRFDDNQNQLSLNQQNMYNYQLHVRRSETAEHSNAALRLYIAIAIILILLLVSSTLYFKNKGKANIIRLHEALNNVKKLKAQLLLSPVVLEPSRPVASAEPYSTANAKSKEYDLREQLRTEIMELYNGIGQNKPDYRNIMLSDAYTKLIEFIKQKKVITNDDRLWNELEQAILNSFPNFTSNLYLLTLDRLTVDEFHTALLIKCGIKPSQMAILLGRSNGTIVSRRQSICEKVLDRNMGTTVIDTIIRLL